jgi:hypothetical protein
MVSFSSVLDTVFIAFVTLALLARSNAIDVANFILIVKVINV